MMQAGSTVIAQKEIRSFRNGDNGFIRRGQSCVMKEIGKETYIVEYDFEKEGDYVSPFTGKHYIVPYVYKMIFELPLSDIDLFILKPQP